MIGFCFFQKKLQLSSINKIVTNYQIAFCKHVTKRVFWTDFLERRDARSCVSTCQQIVARKKSCLLYPASVCPTDNDNFL